ncbi:hypothetical protein [Thalassobacillus hwangdonensis]|uniref:Uncharacterized protein n=1 Tax=Thalassobacillus hwangdonensis TaxID=546108 RepID=A0ABW3KVV9_9BACI
MEDKVKIELSPKQYEKLLETVFIGTWVVNSTKDELDESFEQVRNIVLSHSKEANAAEKVEYVADGDYYDLSVAYETALVDAFIEPYDEQAFFDKLIEKLALKKLAEEVGGLSVPLSEEMIEKKLMYESEIEQGLYKYGLKPLDWKA